MNRLIMSVVAMSAVFTLLTAPRADAQTAKDLVGAWKLVSTVVSKGDTKIDTFGPNPSGMLIFSGDDHFALAFVRSDLPKVASGSRTAQSSDESRAIAQGSIASFGTYTVDDKTLVMRIESSTFPNWSGVEQRLPFSLWLGMS